MVLMGLGAGLSRGWGGQKGNCCGFMIIAGLVSLVLGQVDSSPIPQP